MKGLQSNQYTTNKTEILFFITDADKDNELLKKEIVTSDEAVLYLSMKPYSQVLLKIRTYV